MAQQLIGKAFVHGKYVGVITETESYIGTSDPACHAAKGNTPRTAVMFGPPARTYVYLIYGMYHCLNIVTEQEGFPAAVLIRGIYQIIPDLYDLDGPGKVCRAFGITRHHNNKSVIDPVPDSLAIFESNLSLQWQATPRIGIRIGTDKLWRYVITDKEKKHMRERLEESHISQLFLPCVPRK